LKVRASHQLRSLSFDHRAQQLTRGQNPLAKSFAAQINPKLFGQRRALSIHRQMLLILPDYQLDHKVIGQLALGNNLPRHHGRRHPLLLQTMRTALLPLDHSHPELGRLKGQLFPGLVADDRTFGPALRTPTVFRTAGNEFFPSLQMLRQLLPPGMVTPRLAHRQLLPCLGLFGFLVNFSGSETDLFQHQGHLTRRELLTLGTKHPEVQQANLLVLDLDDPLQPNHLRLQAFEGFSSGLGERIKRGHLMCNAYIYN